MFSIIYPGGDLELHTEQETFMEHIAVPQDGGENLINLNDKYLLI